MIRAAIYARISQADPNTPAVEKQIEACRKLADDAGYTVDGVFKDEGISAFKGKERPGFEEMLGGIGARRFDVILAVAEDRFTRSSEEKFALQTLCTREGVSWHTKASGFVDPSTAQGGFMATLTGAIAEFESAIKTERIRRSVADRLAAGKDLGGPRPFGYEVDRLTIRESEAVPLRAAYASILEGGSVRAIAKAWTDLGIERDRGADIGSPWRTKSVRNILLRERNAGRLVVNGETYAEDRPRIVDPEIFDAVKAILTNPARAPKRGPVPKTYPGLQAVICGACGNQLSIAGSRETAAYRCHPEGRPAWSKTLTGMKHPTMRVQPFDTHLSSKLFYIVGYAAMTGKKLTVTDASIPLLRSQIAELSRQRKIAQELVYLSGADVPLAMRKVTELGEAIKRHEDELEKALGEDVATAAVEAAIEALTGVQTINDLPIGQEPEEWLKHWSSLTVKEKRTLTRALLPGARLLRVPMAQKATIDKVRNRIGRGTRRPLKPSPML